MSDHRGINRRSLLKSGTVIGAGAAAMGVLSGAGFQAPAAQAASVPETWDMETDVVVVGAAGTGLCAALEAADAGAQVIIVDKADHVGGLWVGAGGHAILGATHVHERLGMEDHLEWWYEDEIQENGHRGVPEIIRTYVDMGPDTAKWLEERVGLVWSDVVRANPGHRVDRGLWPAPSDNYPEAGGWPRYAGVAWIVQLKKALAETDTRILLKRRMTRVIRDGDGPVVGIEVDAEGAILNIKARRAVVLASGGFADNAAFAASWDPRLGADIYPDGGGAPAEGPYSENTGDAHKAALAVGASLSDMSFVSFCPIKWGSKVYWIWAPRDWDRLPEAGPGGTGFTIAGDGFKRVVLVRGNGKRYVNESLGAEPHVAEHPEKPFTAAYLNLPERPRNVWAITDAAGADALGWEVALFDNPDPEVFPALYPDAVAKADSLADLAEKMGVDVEGLLETIGRYNDDAKDGVDTEFGKAGPLFPLVKRPFYAVKLCMLRHTQPGGIRINTKAQVLDRSGLFDDAAAVEGLSVDDQGVIPHLYAAGECAAFLGWRRTHGKLGNCATFGRIAGINAAAETPLE